jgi:hypothetical protein
MAQWSHRRHSLSGESRQSQRAALGAGDGFEAGEHRPGSGRWSRPQREHLGIVKGAFKRLRLAWLPRAFLRRWFHNLVGSASGRELHGLGDP